MIRNSLFHATGVWAAAKILRTRTIQLAAAMNSSEHSLKARRKLFYLSTSRIMSNRYRAIRSKVDCTLEFNRDWFEQRYQAKPVDYWDGDWRKRVGSNSGELYNQYGEKEERIFHTKPTIELPPQSFLAIHLLASPEHIDLTRDSRHLRTILIEAKRMGIEIYYYTDEKAYFTGNRHKAVPLRQLIGLLEIVKEDHYYRSYKDWTSEWRELFYKRSVDSLSERARRLSYNLVYHNWNKDQLRALEADLHNNKTQVDQMRKMALIWKKIDVTTIPQFHDYLVEKWRAIYEARNK
jgi:hypothetical protein